jgi:hypothetical protein
MAIEGPSAADHSALSVYVVLARGGASPVTVVAAQDLDGALRAYRQASQHAAGLEGRASPILIARLPENAIPKGQASAMTWLAAVARSSDDMTLVTLVTLE